MQAPNLGDKSKDITLKTNIEMRQTVWGMNRNVASPAEKAENSSDTPRRQMNRNATWPTEKNVLQMNRNATWPAEKGGHQQRQTWETNH